MLALLALGDGLASLLGGLLLGGHLLLALMLLEGLLFESGDVLVERETLFAGVLFYLPPLLGLEFLGRHASFLSFDRELLLHGCHLLG